MSSFSNAAIKTNKSLQCDLQAHLGSSIYIYNGNWKSAKEQSAKENKKIKDRYLPKQKKKTYRKTDLYQQQKVLSDCCNVHRSASNICNASVTCCDACIN